MINKSVLISGAGIAGPTLAYWLARAGFRPTLIEHAPALRAGGYVVDVWGLGYDIAERMGLAAELGRIGYHMREVRVVCERGERVAGFGTRVFGELAGGRYVTLGRSDLSRLIFEKARTTSEVIFGDQIVLLDERADGVQVQFERSAARKFDLVIGADGLHSIVRRLAFGPQDRFETTLGYGVAAFETRGYRPRDEEVYVLHCAPGRMLGRFALDDDRTLFLSVFAGDPRSFPATLDLAAHKAILCREFGDAAWETPRILDALEGVSLMAGQGSALAMTAAYVLAGELAHAEGRHEPAFGRYEGLLRSFIESKQRGAERFAAAFAPRTRWGLFVRNQVMNAFAIPGLASLMFGRDIADRLPLPRYRWPAAMGGDAQTRPASRRAR